MNKEKPESLEECGIEEHFIITYCFRTDCTLHQGGECAAKLYRAKEANILSPHRVEKQKIEVIFNQLSESIKLLEQVTFKSDSSRNEKVIDVLYNLENAKRELRLLMQ